MDRVTMISWLPRGTFQTECPLPTCYYRGKKNPHIPFSNFPLQLTGSPTQFWTMRYKKVADGILKMLIISLAGEKN